MADGLDSVYGAPVPPDQQPTAAKAAAAAAKKTSDTFVLEKSGLNVVANGSYAFAFAYEYADPDNPSATVLGPRSANFRFNLEAPDLTVAAQNVVVTPGLLSYGVKWDVIDKSLATNKWFIDAQIYESLTGAFAGEEYLVWNGTGNSATILVSNTNDRWIRVDTRDQDYHKKSVKKGPFNATDPIIVDTTGPDNVSSVTTSGGIDTSGYLGFNAYANISWPAVTGKGIRGYRIRFSNDNNSTYSYADSPGTGTTYKLEGLAIGSTYKIAVATYDEFNNTSSSYISGPDVTVTGTPSVTNYITGGPFQFGVGVGGVSTQKGLYFDANNYWYINSLNSARLKVGGSTSNYLLWDGATFAIDGNITARGGTFSGNILMSTTNASIYNGTINASGNLTGDGFALNSSGLKVAKGTNSITLDAATGTITANAGTIAGWTLGASTLSKNNVIIDSAGKIQIGAAAATSVYLQKAAGTSPTKDYVMWAGNNTPDSNAKFRVAADGTLYATGAIFGTGTTVSGYATSTDLGTTNTNVANAASAAATAQTTATNAATAAANAATAAASKLTKSANTIADSSNNITGINTNGITIFTGSSGATTVPTSGARVVMNSAGIAAYDSTSTSNSTGVTFSLNASNGSAIFKGDITGASGTFNGNVNLVDTGGTWLSNPGVNIQSSNLFGQSGKTAINAGSMSLTLNNTSSYISAATGAGSEPVGSLMLGSDSQIHLYGVGQGSGSIYLNRPVFVGYATTFATYIDLGQQTTRIYSNGSIYANSLNSQGTSTGATTGTAVIQNSSGYLKVSGSSRRFKENILSLSKDGYLDALMLVNPVNFNYIGEDEIVSGLIAEELNEIEKFKGVVNYDLQGDPISIAYDRMSSLLVLAIKEIKDSLDSISVRLDALEG